jgi:hypothetical protein
MHFWIERMTLAFLESEQKSGAEVRPVRAGFDLRWPDGHQVHDAVFSVEEADKSGTAFLALDNEHVRSLTRDLPVLVPAQPVPTVTIRDISDKVTGLWSLWRIGVHAGEEKQERYMPLFIGDDGRSLVPTARAVWERLIASSDDVQAVGSCDIGMQRYEACRIAAETHGKTIFEELTSKHRESVARERRKLNYAFSSRRRAIERMGLPNVRARRLARLTEEETHALEKLGQREAALPELTPLMFVRIAAKATS